LLKLELEHHEQSKEDLIEKYRNQIKSIENQFDQQKLLLLNVTQNQDQRYALVSKQQQEFNDLIQIKIDENKNLAETNVQLENNLKQNHQLILEKNKQIEDFQMKFNQIKEEKNKLTHEINLLMDKITILEKDKAQFIQVKVILTTFFHIF
jgi:uncharacterized membrane protein